MGTRYAILRERDLMGLLRPTETGVSFTLEGQPLPADARIVAVRVPDEFIPAVWMLLTSREWDGDLMPLSVPGLVAHMAEVLV